MKTAFKKIWGSVGVLGLVAALLWGELIYMNLRPADDLLTGWEEYDETKFTEYQKAGEPILVEVYAPWCPTCLLQHKAFETLVENGEAPKIRAIRVDFDTNEAFRQRHGLYSTGMLLVYKNGLEVSRAAGLVTPEKIKAFLAQNNVT